VELYLYSPRRLHGVVWETFAFTFTFTSRNLELTLQLERCKNLQKKCVCHSVWNTTWLYGFFRTVGPRKPRQLYRGLVFRTTLWACIQSIEWSELAQAVDLLTCTWKLLGPNFDRGTGNNGWDYFLFSLVLWRKCRVSVLSRSDEFKASALGYGYVRARTDTTQQTSICLGIHCRNVWLHLTLILLTWRIWWDPNNASKWQMGFNSTFKGLNRRPFWPLQRHSNPMRTAASIWPDFRLETNSLCWRQTVGRDNIPVVSVSV